MKKLIGIILALCMLTTMASAAVTGNATASDLEKMTVTVTYAGLAADAQATLLAYKVADSATASSIPAFDNNPLSIVGIDQEAVDGSFEFKVAKTFRGKIAVKVGGTDALPATFLVEFKETSDGVTFIWGDVNGDGTVDVTDGTAIINSTSGGQKIFGNYEIGVEVTIK